MRASGLTQAAIVGNAVNAMPNTRAIG